MYESDSIRGMPYVYMINHNTGNGTISDYNGNFSIIASDLDTLVFTYLGYAKKKFPVLRIKNINDSTKSSMRVYMQRIMIDLPMANAFTYKIKPNEIDYMKRYIKDHSRTKGVNAFESPITALYDRLSRKGREQQKLQELFQQILIQEEVSKKFNPEILRQLTEDEFVDYETFRKYCWYINDEFILNNNGYALYAPIMECYRRWKREGR